jgi:hypothetical protein
MKIANKDITVKNTGSITIEATELELRPVKKK